jgi:hypothetical protein
MEAFKMQPYRNYSGFIIIERKNIAAGALDFDFIFQLGALQHNLFYNYSIK